MSNIFLIGWFLMLSGFNVSAPDMPEGPKGANGPSKPPTYITK